jgi:hypothetical protein
MGGGHEEDIEQILSRYFGIGLKGDTRRMKCRVTLVSVELRSANVLL